MKSLAELDYLPGVVYRTTSAYPFGPGMQVAECAINCGGIGGASVSLSLVDTGGSNCTCQIAGTTRYSQERRPNRAAARDWGEFLYHQMPSLVWHLTPVIEAAFGLPFSRHYPQHAAPHEVLIEPWKLDYTCRGPPSVAFTRNFEHADTPDPRGPLTAGLDQLFQRLPPMFGPTMRVRSLEFDSPTRRHRLNIQHYVFVQSDHTLDCLAQLPDEERDVIIQRYGVGTGKRSTVDEVHQVLAMRFSGRPKSEITRVERAALEHMHALAGTYARQPLTISRLGTE